ncbi:MAG: alpha-amylase family protein [Dysgonamonadaceae bacterium]|nr:alpha-amylase family protein [Dysgonamonadaceae bacterium]
MNMKVVIYQVLPRLFGNVNATNARNGSIIENGCGKMSAFSVKVLDEIRSMGVTHIWFTGVIEHASQTAYDEYGIAADNADVVKGIAGSPYAIRDYYDIDPDIADSVPSRMDEFDALTGRCRAAGLKVLIDFIPNHVARHYHSDCHPQGSVDLGAHDKASSAFDVNNNFYYLPGQLFTPPDGNQDSTRCYYEFPAKATGNDCFTANPSRYDWYETVKLNYGIDYVNGNRCYFNPVPDTWYKMKNILLYWASKHVDGFRCDMAEMVPVEFWQWVIPAVKAAYPDVIFIAEVYNPQRYRDYFHRGKFDYLYDKVGLYDTLRDIICNNRSANDITYCWQALGELQPRMLNFLENHDEQRIASEYFASCPLKARPAFVVASAINTNAVMVYSGQELGERGMNMEGFSGLDGRTTIFDYWSVDSIRDWYNDGKVNEELLSDEQRAIRDFYIKVMRLCNESPAIREGKFFDLMYINPAGEHFNPHRQFAWMRCADEELLLLVANFDSRDVEINIFIPENAFNYFELHNISFSYAQDLLSGEDMPATIGKNSSYSMRVRAHDARIVSFYHRR